MGKARPGTLRDAERAEQRRSRRAREGCGLRSPTVLGTLPFVTLFGGSFADAALWPSTPAPISLSVSPAIAGSAPHRALADGWDFLERGKWRYAKIAFSNRLRREPENHEARLGLGLSLLELGDPQGASRALLEALRALPEDFRGRLGLARAMLARARERIAVGEWDDETRLLLLDAAQQAERAARIEASRSEPWLCLAQVRFELRDLSAARSALDRALERGADTAAHSKLAVELDGLRVLGELENSAEPDFAAAERALEELAARQPDEPVPLVHLGDLLGMAGDPVRAIEAYGRALERDPFQRELLEYLVGFLNVPGTEDALRQALDAAAKSAEARAEDDEDPRPAAAFQALAEVELHARNWENAKKLFERSARLDETRALPCALGRGTSAFRLGDHDAATRAYLEAFRLDQAACVRRLERIGAARAVGSSLLFLAHRATEAKALPEARDLFGAAAELLPEDSGACNDHALLSRDTGAYEESYRSYRRLLELTPDDPRAWNDAALLLQYHLHRDLDEARRMYQHAIELADQRIAAADTPEDTKERARDARKDATENLRKLDAGK